MNKYIKDLSFVIGKCKSSKAISDSTLNELRDILSDALKHVEAISASREHFVFSDVMGALIDILTRSQLPEDVKEQTGVFLETLIKLDSKSRDILDEIGLSRCLLHCLAERPPSNVQCQVLRLLQQASYESKLSWLHTENYSLSLVHVIIDSLIENPTGLTFEVSLGVLVNFCRNLHCRNFVKNTDRFSRLKSLLLGCLNADNLRVIIYSMTLIFQLSSGGEKIFSTRNIHQTLELVLNTLLNNFSGWTPFYAADLLMDLAKASSSRPYLENFQYLSASLRNISVLICQKPRHVQRKCLELLLVFCDVSSHLRRAVAELLFGREAIQSEEHFARLLGSASARKESLLFALAGLVSYENSTESELAAAVLRAAYEELLRPGSALEPRLALMDRMLSSTPVASDSAPRGEVEGLVWKWSHLVELSTVLLDHDGWFPLVSQPVHAQNLEQLLIDQLNSNLLCTAMRLPKEDAAALEGARLALRCLHFMYTIAERHQGSTTYEQSLARHLQDARVAPLLAFGILSGETTFTQLSLGLVATGLLLDDFSITLLGDCFSNFSQSLRRTSSKPCAPPASFPASPAISGHAAPLTEQENRRPAASKLDEAVTELVRSFSAGAGLKDAKSSDLLALYEHKLQTLQTKESHLEDMLATKTMSLAQADALIARNRSRLAVCEAENQSLRNILLEHERHRERNEEAQKKQSEALKELAREKSHADSELKRTSAKLQETTGALSRSLDQTKRLQESLSETAAALKKAQEQCQRFQEDAAAKGRNIKELNRNIDSYRSRLDEAELEINEKKKQILKFSEITKMLSSLTVDPEVAEPNLGNSGNSGNSG